MRVVCIFPITGNEKNIPGIYEIFRSKIKPEFFKLGANAVELKFPEISYTYVPNIPTPEGMPKGRGILGCLKNVLNTPDVVICCDGSGKIPYEYIVDIFQELTSDHDICCVMANRRGYKAIDDFRYLIERFEVFAITRYHNHKKKILDGQCGLWAYRSGKLNGDGFEKEIILTSEGYEIELDLLGEVLKNNLSYSFIDVDLPQKDALSKFKYKDNIKKIKFFLEKYDKFSDCIPEYINDFKKTDFFNKQIKKNTIKEQWDVYETDLLKIVK